MNIREGGGIHTTVMGRKAIVIPWLHTVTGDTSRHNNVCGHFNPNGATADTCRDCHHSYDELESSHPICVPDPDNKSVTLAELEEAMKYTTHMKEISKHPVKISFLKVPISRKKTWDFWTYSTRKDATCTWS